MLMNRDSKQKMVDVMEYHDMSASQIIRALVRKEYSRINSTNEGTKA